MTKEQLEAIRERVQTAKEFAERCPSIRPTPDHGRAIADRAALLEEVDRLRARVMELETELAEAWDDPAGRAMCGA